MVRRQRLSEIILSGACISLIKKVGKFREEEYILKFVLLYLLAVANSLNLGSLPKVTGQV